MIDALKLLLPNFPNKLSLIGAFIGYPIGKMMLLIFTLGQYPDKNKKHNEMFVALTPLWVFFVGVTIYFDYR